MNKLELLVYNAVKNRPVLKQAIVDIYQAIASVVPQEPLVSSFPIVERQGYFFGFHDKSPFSADGTMLLAHRNLIGDRVVAAGDPVEIGLFEGTEWNSYRPVATSRAWNWQLGSMLQWFGSTGTWVAYNDARDGAVTGFVCAVDERKPRPLPWPVVHVSPNCNRVCSYDFARVEAAMPGYGAVLPPSPAREEKKEFFRVWEPETGRITFEISLAEVRLIDPMPSMEGAFHFFHHALFNPEGTRLFFLHRWVDKNMRRWTRMFTVAENGDDLYLFPMREMVSHITWASNSEVFTYARSPEHGDGYFLVEDRTGRMTPFFRPRLNSDGHPTMDKRRGYVITDTYPDRFRNQYLYLGDILTQSLKVLCRTHLPRQFRRELQVDLHPRLHPTRDVACFDSGHRGGRSLLTLDFSGAVSAPAG